MTKLGGSGKLPAQAKIKEAVAKMVEMTMAGQVVERPELSKYYMFAWNAIDGKPFYYTGMFGKQYRALRFGMVVAFLGDSPDSVVQVTTLHQKPAFLTGLNYRGLKEKFERKWREPSPGDDANEPDRFDQTDGQINPDYELHFMMDGRYYPAKGSAFRGGRVENDLDDWDEEGWERGDQYEDEEDYEGAPGYDRQAGEYVQLGWNEGEITRSYPSVESYHDFDFDPDRGERYGDDESEAEREYYRQAEENTNLALYSFGTPRPEDPDDNFIAGWEQVEEDEAVPF